jgi:hypothetical protein
VGRGEKLNKNGRQAPRSAVKDKPKNSTLPMVCNEKMASLHV